MTNSLPFALSEVEGHGHTPRCFDYAQHERKGAGFTLIEIMVALAVFSLAAMALMRLEGATIRGAATLDATLTAQMVARTVAVDAVTDVQPPAPGRSDGRSANGGRAWTWTRVVSNAGGGGIVRIDVSVADRTGQVLARTTMVRR